MGLFDLFKKKKTAKPTGEAIKTPAAAESPALIAVSTVAATKEEDKTLTIKNVHILSDSVKWKERRDAARALGECGDKESIAALCSALKKDESWVVRFICAEALGNIGDPDALPSLISALGDKNTSVVAYAGEALGKLKTASAVEPMINALETFVLADSGDDETGIKGVCEGLGTLGEPAVMPLINRIHTSIHKEAVTALSKTKSKLAERTLLDVALDDTEEPHLRASAILGLGEIEGASCIDRLLALFSEATDETIVNSCGKALEKLNVKVDNASELKAQAKRRTAEKLLYGLRSIHAGMDEDEAERLVGSASFSMGANQVHKTQFGDFQLIVVNGRVTASLYVDGVVKKIEEYLKSVAFN